MVPGSLETCNRKVVKYVRGKDTSGVETDSGNKTDNTKSMSGSQKRKSSPEATVESKGNGGSKKRTSASLEPIPESGSILKKSKTSASPEQSLEAGSSTKKKRNVEDIDAKIKELANDECKFSFGAHV